MPTVKFISDVDGSFQWQTTNMNQLIPDNAIKVSENVYKIPVVEPEPEPDPVPSVLSVAEFKAFFTLTERIAIEESVDVGVGIIWNDIEDPRTTSVDLGAPSTIEAIDHLATAGVITEDPATERKAQ